MLMLIDTIYSMVQLYETYLIKSLYIVIGKLAQMMSSNISLKRLNQGMKIDYFNSNIPTN